MSDEGLPERRMKVLRVREHAEGADVAFIESARIYLLARRNPAYAEALAALLAAEGRGKPLRVRLDKPHGEVIEAVDGA